MALPAETEKRVKRRALRGCRDHFRKVLNLTRVIPRVIDCFIKGDKEGARKHFEEIRSKEEEVDDARRSVSRELAEIGGILLSREDFLRFTNLTSEIADFCEGIAFRLVEIMEHDWEIPESIKEDLQELSDSVLDAVLMLRETMMVLRYGADKTMKKAKEVEIAEQAVDDLYRKMGIKILDSDLDIPALILLRDILQLLEDSADKAEDAADAARIVALIL